MLRTKINFNYLYRKLGSYYFNSNKEREFEFICISPLLKDVEWNIRKGTSNNTEKTLSLHKPLLDPQSECCK